MSRWWADAETSRATLALVDDSDVVQGVGTAVLGYHGLAAGALEPLTRRTLMDVSAVHQALSGVDLEPVAKAMSAATQSTMGEASGPYGRMLAEDLHRQAVDATERLLLSLTGTGMPWPTAIERIATVHGVPLERLGKAATELGKPALTPMVRADIGDRALMDYAAHLGKREDTGSVSVSKAGAVFEEKEHPRGRAGRFVDAPKRTLPDDDLEERIGRRKRRMGRIKAQSEKAANARRTLAEQAGPPASGMSLMDVLSNMISSDTPKALAPAVARAEGRARGRQRGSRDRRENARRRAEATVEEATAASGGFSLLDSPVPISGGERRTEGERMALVPRHIADALVAEGGANYNQLLKLLKTDKAGDGLPWERPDDMKETLSLYDGAYAKGIQQYVLLMIDGNIPTVEGDSRADFVEIAPSALLQVRDDKGEGVFNYSNEPGYHVTMPALGKNPNPGKAGKEWKYPVDILHLVVGNADQYDYPIDPGTPRAAAGIHSLPHDKIGKAFQFRESDVKRDPRGRFDHEPGSGGGRTPDDDLEARMARRKRRGQRSAVMASRRKAVQSATPAPPLSEESMAILRGMLADDPIVREMDTVESLSSRKRGRERGSRLRTRENRLVSGGTPVDGDKSGTQQEIDLASAQSIVLSYEQLLAMDRIGEQDVDPVVRMATVLSDGTRGDTPARVALEEMGLAARREIATAKDALRKEAQFEWGTEYKSSEAAYAAAQDFIVTMQAVAEPGSSVAYMVHGDPDGRTDTGSTIRSMPYNNIVTAVPYVKVRHDSQSNVTYTPMLVSRLQGVNAQAMFAGTSEDIARLRNDELPNDFVEGETTFREAAKAAGVHEDIINMTPNFTIRTITPVFGQNDD